MHSRASVMSLPAQRSLHWMGGSAFDLAGLSITAAHRDAFEALTPGCSSNFVHRCRRSWRSATPGRATRSPPLFVSVTPRIALT
jgi:hypothetical protein